MAFRQRLPCKFQFTPLREGRLRTGHLVTPLNKFQFTPLREGRPYAELLVQITEIFQFTPLREGRPTLATPFRAAFAFQFTPLREGRPSLRRNSRAPISNFNSRPSARGDMHAEKLRVSSHISIHAPPRGATSATCVPRVLRISIHAPPRGATNERKSRNGAVYYFNSRPSARGDVPQYPAL